MSVYVDKKNGEVVDFHVHDEDVYNVMKSIAYLIDLCQEGAGLDIEEFQTNENHKALMLIMKEF
jgi:hypothetical protein